MGLMEIFKKLRQKRAAAAAQGAGGAGELPAGGAEKPGEREELFDEDEIKAMGHVYGGLPASGRTDQLSRFLIRSSIKKPKKGK